MIYERERATGLSRSAYLMSKVIVLGTVTVFQGNAPLTVMHPEKRAYASGGQVMTEAAIDPGFARDLYVALGEPLGGDAWALRVHVKPFVRWIWAGALLMMLGGLAALIFRRTWFTPRAFSPKRASSPHPGPEER